MVFHLTDTGSHAHMETVFVKSQKELHLNSCSKCMLKWHDVNHILNRCRRAILPPSTTKPGTFSRWISNKVTGAKVSMSTASQRLGGTNDPRILKCYEDRLKTLITGEFSKNIFSNKCLQKCALFSDAGVSAATPNPVAGANGAATPDAADENGLSDVIIPTLAHKLVESRRRIEIANAFL